MIEFESNSEKIVGMGCLTLAEIVLIAVGSVGGPIGMTVGALILPAIAIVARL